jgi:hypothetical protein
MYSEEKVWRNRSFSDCYCTDRKFLLNVTKCYSTLAMEVAELNTVWEKLFGYRSSPSCKVTVDQRTGASNCTTTANQNAMCKFGMRECGGGASFKGV